jgi:hypothetical protein
MKALRLTPAHARLVGSAVLAVCAAGGVVVTGACASSPDTSRVTEVYTPDDAFVQWIGGTTGTGPDAVIGQRCGTLDCHGQLGRPLRIFSQSGLRLVDEAGAIPGGIPETEDEQFANFTAAISLQPELTSEVFAGSQDPHAVLLLLRKPLQLERHKGGQVFQPNDPGDTCLTTWLQDNTDYKACATALQVP